MSTSPRLFSSGFKSRDEVPICAVPAETASIPAEDPSPDTNTEAFGCAFLKASADCSAMGRMVVEPLTIILSALVFEPEQPDSQSAPRARMTASATLVSGCRRVLRDDP